MGRVGGEKYIESFSKKHRLIFSTLKLFESFPINHVRVREKQNSPSVNHSGSVCVLDPCKLTPESKAIGPALLLKGSDLTKPRGFLPNGSGGHGLSRWRGDSPTCPLPPSGRHRPARSDATAGGIALSRCSAYQPRPLTAALPLWILALGKCRG